MQSAPTMLKDEEMMDDDQKTLKEACRMFEVRYGIEAFLDTMAAIMQDRLGGHGLNIQYVEDELGDQDCVQVVGGCDHKGVRPGHR